MESIQWVKPRALVARKPVRMILVGGFLGAGKTTALGALARELGKKGLKVGFVTNDQAAGLVDTLVAQDGNDSVGEVAGGCFCCKFDDLIDVTQTLLDEGPDVLLCEPVGSCTDMAATVLNPLRQFYKDIFSFAPFTVVVDPIRLKQALEEHSEFPKEVLYIFWKQLEEADLIALNKCDTLTDSEIKTLTDALTECCKKPVISLSATEGDYVASWAESLLSTDLSGQNILKEINYDTYATGEAVLGWLNATCEVKGAGYEGRLLIESLMNKLNSQCSMLGAEIAHIKIALQSPGRLIRANLTRTHAKTFVADDGKGPMGDATLTVNARVDTKPGALGGLVVRSIEAIDREGEATLIVATLESFSPGYPRPPYRMEEAAP